MGVLEDLARAREDYERGQWATAFDGFSEADPDRLGVDDLERLGTAAGLLARHEVARHHYQRAFARHETDGDVVGAVRCCFRLSMMLASSGDPALAAGWSARAARILEEADADPALDASRGYVSFLLMFRHLGSADWEAAGRAAAVAAEAGRLAGDSDLRALGLCGQGRCALYAGRPAEGLACLDEAMAQVTAGVRDPVVAGHVYCVAIEGCQEIGDLGRVAEWTTELTRWCDEQPGLVTFTGQCSVHRGQVMRQRGAWTAALEELATAIERYDEAGIPHAVGLAETERGDLHRLRGDHAEADAAYQRAAEHGHDPQPGLALLWLAGGSRTAAVAAIRRLLAEAVSPVHRTRLLPAAVEVLLAEGLLEEAERAAADLDRAAAEIGSSALVAAAAYAAGHVCLSSGDAAGSLPYLRTALQVWTRALCPYDAARVRCLTGRALAALGDAASSRRELATARAAFEDLGARPDVAAVDRMLAPDRAPGGLTAREVEVLRLVAAGRSNAQIAAELVLSEKTVARHLSNIFGKLDVGSRTAAAAYAFEHGLS